MKRAAVAAAVVMFVVLVVTGAGVHQRHEVFRRAAGLPEFVAPGAVESVVDVPMRDGVTLHTELFLPEGLAKAPAILVRNPYEYLKPVERLQCQTMARYGYACVLQDVRGQMESGGEWYPILNERDDGLDTLAWLVKQPFVDGNIGLRGPSYLTCVQWAVADALPPEVKTMIPSVFGTDLRLVWTERGSFRHDILTAWATLMPGRGMRQLAGDDYLSAAKHLPPAEADERFMTKRVEWYREAQAAAAEPPDGPYWQQERMVVFRTMPERTKVPMLFVGAFFDPFFEAQRDTWNRAATQAQSVYVVGPWNHLGLTSGDVDFSAAPGRLDQWPLMFEWFEHTLKGKPLVTLKPGTVRTWGPGDTGWREHARWPDPAVPRVRFTLEGDALAAQSCDGGTLSPLGETGPGSPHALAPPPADADAGIPFTYDPADPNPTRGGASLLSFAFFRTLGLTPGPVDQGDSCTRGDVLTFRGPPTRVASRLSGAAKLTLKVASSAPDTAFVARLIAEQDGTALLVREASATLAWPREGLLSPETYTPGAPVELELDFWPMEWVLPAGGRWRLDVSSSSFPALHAHVNRAGPWHLQTGADVAQQTVFPAASVLELPVSAATR